MNKKVWVVSPNVQNGETTNYWIERSLAEKKVFVGYDSDAKHGKTFNENFKIGDYIIIAQGAKDKRTIYLIGVIKSDRKKDIDKEVFYRDITLVISDEELIKHIVLDNNNAYGNSNNPGTIYELKYTNSYDSLVINKLKQMIEINNLIEILKYKKQIVLQGPPGTGKTRLAKEIAQQIIGNNEIDVPFIKNKLSVGLKFSSVGKREIFQIISINQDNVEISTSGENRLPTFNGILKYFNNNLGWKTTDLKNVQAYEMALAKYLYENVHIRNNSSNQLNFIQFHPSYTYEDFVRGIVSKPNEDGDGIVYEAENKILAEFAKKALVNYKLSNENNTIEFESKSVFDAFIDSIKDELAQSEDHKYNITDAVYLFSADESRFKYKGDNWVAHNKGLNMKFSELKKIIDTGATERQDIKRMTDVEELTRQHATYFIKIVEKYYTFKQTFNESIPFQQDIELKNYVLIVDEINRANLSSVLGELIYALEYRGEAVESMYEVEGNNKLILPPNLYIIGTMNTADRSVGHIDYAIRRRFVFVNVLPEDLSKEEGIKFDSKLFHQVAELFETNLSPEFEKKDVQLGHSYFIDKSHEGGSMEMRLEYEIKPILLEYVKDGVLIGDDINKKIEDLEVSI